MGTGKNLYNNAKKHVITVGSLPEGHKSLNRAAGRMKLLGHAKFIIISARYHRRQKLGLNASVSQRFDPATESLVAVVGGRAGMGLRLHMVYRSVKARLKTWRRTLFAREVFAKRFIASVHDLS